MSVLRATEVLWKSRKDGVSDRHSGLPLVLFERMGVGWGSTQNIVHTPPGGICIIFLEMVMSWILKDVQKLARCQISIQVFQKEGTRTRAVSRPGRWRSIQWASQCGSDWGVRGTPGQRLEEGWAMWPKTQEAVGWPGSWLLLGTFNIVLLIRKLRLRELD